jgi:hypothetical protein
VKNRLRAWPKNPQNKAEPPRMPIRIAVIAEAEADRRQICEMIDRKICHHAPDWWEEDQLEIERVYCGLLPGTPFTKWADLRKIQAPNALRSGGFIGFGRGQNRRFDYALGRKALNHCVLTHPNMDAVVLVRDMDQQPDERRASLVQAESEFSSVALTVILALPRSKREAWVLNGFMPLHADEAAKLDSVRSELSFDPCERAEKLYAMKTGAKRDAKRVLACLIGDDPEREAKCWCDTDWNILRKRGTGSGLTQFLKDVKERLVPLIIGQKRKP